MTVTAKILDQVPLDEALAMIIVGEKKAGKSLLAATAPEPVLFFDFDLRSGSLKGKPGVYSLSFQDPSVAGQQPTAFNEMLQVLAQMEKTRELRLLHTVFKDVPAGLNVKTVVFDSVHTIANAARKYAMYGNDDISKNHTIAGKSYRVAKNWHAWGAEQAMVEGAIMQARALPGLNVIAVLHECMEQDERSTEDNPIYTGKIEVYPRRYNSLLVYFDEVWRVVRQTGRKPTVQIDPDGKFLMASTALGLDKVEYPNIKDMLAKAKASQQKK